MISQESPEDKRGSLVLIWTPTVLDHRILVAPGILRKRCARRKQAGMPSANTQASRDIGDRYLPQYSGQRPDGYYFTCLINAHNRRCEICSHHSIHLCSNSSPTWLYLMCDWKHELAAAANLWFESHDALILPFLPLVLLGTASLDGKERLPAPGDRLRSAFLAPPAV
jgi:hypothetical protein